MLARHLRLPAFVICILLITGLSAQTATLSSYNGTWKINRVGFGCTPTATISVKISDGQITGSYRGGTGTHVISGTIKENGKFKFVGRSSETVSFRGKISGNSGTGRWNVVGRSCGGNLEIFR